MQGKILFRILSTYLIVATFFLTLPAQGWAMFIPSGGSAAVRQADMSSIQKNLESSLLKQRLSDLGLSSDETMARVNSLSDEQIHQFAADLDSLQAGGDGLGALIFLVLVAIIVVVVLQVTGHRVIIK